MDWLGILIGGGITFVVSLFFYVPAARSLEQETARLRRHTTLILRGLEEAGLAEYNRNEQGEIVGIHIKRTATASVGNIDAASSATMKRGEDDKDAPANQE